LGGEEKGRRLSASSFYFAYLFISAPDDFVTVQSESSESKNHLAQSRSPYLLQHVANPVDWHEWGETAFHIAKERDMPIFLSVGYSTCQWCHVMAHESFENEAIASKMNSHFVNIKVDREERPDVDRIYMAFVQSLTGGGGWPMSVWLTPDLKPFYGGTYFPPQNRYGRIGFSELIDKIGALWREKRADLSEQSNKYVNTLTESSIPDHPKEAGLTMVAADRCLEELDQQFDDRWGGFGAAPKFPMPSYLSFLLERVDFGEQSEEERKLLGITLDRMAEGGIRDFIVGGFHRYSVDRYWHVPHFEKMLYDQGQLATVYADSSRLLGRMDDLATASEIVSYVGERLAAPEGGIYSAEDADSPLPGNPTKSGEGAFYVWKAGELIISMQELYDEPKAGDAFTILSADSVTGNFFSTRVLNGSNRGAGVSRKVKVDLAYTSTSVDATVALLAIERYSDWKDGFFSEADAADDSISGAGRDPDGDGYNNLAEYALGGDPRSLDPDLVTYEIMESSTVVTSLSTTSETPTASESVASISFNWANDVTDATWEIARSSDLENWEAVDPLDILMEPNGDYTRITGTQLRPTSSEEDLFLRVQIVEAPQP